MKFTKSFPAKASANPKVPTMMINLKTLYLWINTYKKANNIQTRTRKEFQEPIRKESLEDELKRVKRELVIAKQERDILKKATAYFAKEVL